ncbi:MAG: MBL fold metallo-hydrolase [Rubrobacter sp.]|nr:MBL fold metallo-hydrolase [Rubrobacter sp.]
MRIETIDLNFMETPHTIASFLLLGDGGRAALVETGPTTCLESLLRGIKERGVSPEEVGEVFLTHIHLDHAGASGHLVEELPDATFYVHEVGYPHMADPSKLLRSATRIYGENMDVLWGEVRPMPEDRMVALKGGERVPAAGGVLEAHYTPGHAYHHLAYLEPDSGALFAGDVGGIRLPGCTYVRPPTPPPEVDIEAWLRSLYLVRSLSPASLWPTHFGSYEDVGRHLDELEGRLKDWSSFVAERMERGLGRERIAAELEERGNAELRASGADAEDLARYELAGAYWMLVDGLMRYIERRKRP